MKALAPAPFERRLARAAPDPGQTMPDDGPTSGGAAPALTLRHPVCARIFAVKVTRPRSPALLGSVLLLSSALTAFAQIDAATRAKAVRVETLIDKVRGETERVTAPLGRTEAVAEDDLNAYIACRLFDDQEPVMKELRLKLLSGNRFEGMTVLDFTGVDLPGLLRGRLDVYFAGRLETQGGAVRLDIGTFFINGQKVRPEILDAVISIGSRLSGTEAFSLRDWYILPYGLRDMAVEEGRLLAFYAP